MQTETIYIYENDGGTLELLDYQPSSRYHYDYVIEDASYHIKNGVLSIKGNKVNFEKVYQDTFEDEELDYYELNSKYIDGTITEKTYTMLTWKGFKKITVNEDFLDCLGDFVCVLKILLGKVPKLPISLLDLAGASHFINLNDIQKKN